MDYKQLKAKHRALREHFSQNLSLRVHRALSWLNRSELSDDTDAKFIFLWIAFNAAYAQELMDKSFGESGKIAMFIKKIVALDKQQRLYDILWGQYSSSIRLLLNNQFVFQPFWDFHNTAEPNINEADWKTHFSQAKAIAHRALANKRSDKLLTLILQRLYTLRNQLIHGGATWQGAANREQVRDCTVILGAIVPVIIDIMMDSPKELWGDAIYPVI